MEVSTEAMRIAIKAGDEEKVLEILRAGYEINARDIVTGKTALYEAVANNQLACVKLLLQWQADVNVVCNSGTAVHAAARHGLKDVIAELLEHDVNFKLRSNEKMTPLEVAIRYGHNRVTRMIITKMERVPCSRMPLLCMALALFTDRTILLFMERCCECHYTMMHNTVEGLLPIHVAVKTSNYNAVKYILSRFKVQANSMTQSNLDSLYTAVMLDDLKMVKLLVRNGAKLKMTSRGYHLHLAAAAGFYKICKFFLSNRLGDINLHDLDGSTVLHKAVTSHKPKMVELFLHYGANPRLRSLYNKKTTALVDAVTLGHKTMVKSLLDAGCEATEISDGCNSVLDIAIRKKYARIIEYLLRRKAVLNARDDTCTFAIDIALPRFIIVAESYGTSKPAHILQSIESINKSEKWRTCYNDCMKDIEMLENHKFYKEFTLRDVLVADVKLLAEIVRNPDLVESYYTVYCETHLPIFKVRADYNIRSALQRHEIMIKADAALEKTLPFMPALLRDKVMRNLENEDLKNFTKAVFDT